MKNLQFGKYTFNEDPVDYSSFKEAVNKRNDVEMSVIDTGGSPGGESQDFKTKMLLARWQEI
ncbi:MAG: hypothetical protein K9L17_04880 [Clostridiales bacterium]|nr:hypothetical protein [Clostridiales bacterium]MCF8022008.1 hypothetical protein [Clostridiales bacterium]